MPKLTWLPSTVELGEMTTYVFNEIFCLLGVADVEKDNEDSDSLHLIVVGRVYSFKIIADMVTNLNYMEVML